METHRLKTITIVILLLLNLFLLALLLNFRLQQVRTGARLEEELFRLYEASEMSIDEDVPLDGAPLPSLSLTRDLELEAAIARMILGEEAVEGVHEGGGIYTYTGEAGTIQFRSTGAFDFVSDRRQTADPGAFFLSFCDTFGYTPLQQREEGGAYSAARVVGGHPVYNCTVTFRFGEGGSLLSAAGSCLSEKGSAQLDAATFSTADALVKFLSYRGESGAICNRILSVSPVYALHTSASSDSQLAAQWRITTDTYQYYVDCSTGGIVRS